MRIQTCRPWLTRAAVITASTLMFGGPRAVLGRAAPGSEPATGVWAGTVSLGGHERSFAIQLVERTNGNLIGYLLGGTSGRTVVSGRHDPSGLQLTIEIASPGAVQTLAVDGGVGSDAIRAVVSDGLHEVRVRFKRVRDQVSERRFVFVGLDPSGNATGSTELSVALDTKGRYLAGAWVGRNNCDLWGCEGEVTSFSESGTSLTVGLALDTCGDGSHADLVFAYDPSLGGNFYSGTYTLSSCSATSSGTVIGGRSTRTTSADAASILGQLGVLADGLEASAPLSRAHPSFSPTYLDWGATRADVADQYNGERLRYTDIRADFGRVSMLSTEVDADAAPFLLPPHAAALAERRSGMPVGGGARTTYVDTARKPIRPLLVDWIREGDAWVITGNQRPALDLPFPYAVSTRPDFIEVWSTVPAPPSLAGPVYVSLGTMGAHFLPLTGHAVGKASADHVGFFTPDTASMTELAGDGDGICESGESCGVASSLIDARRPLYTAPEEGVVDAVEFIAGPSTFYYHNEAHWRVRFRLATGEALELGHIGRISGALAGRILGVTGIDVNAYGGPVGNILGEATIPVSAGLPLGVMQVAARPIGGYPGYFTGNGTVEDRPWVQIEYAMTADLAAPPSRVCAYDYLSPSLQATLQNVIEAGMANPASPRFAPYASTRWQWLAEARACMTFSADPHDFSALYTNLGGWFEREEGGIAGDEALGFAPVARDTAMYDPLLYDSPGVDMLVTRVHPQASSLRFQLVLPDGSLAAVPWLAGEVLERTPTGLLVKWRDVSAAWPAVYQRAAYRLDAQGLTVRWGALAASAGAAAMPVLSTDAPCNGADLACYDHTFREGY